MKAKMLRMSKFPGDKRIGAQYLEIGGRVLVRPTNSAFMVLFLLLFTLPLFLAMTSSAQIQSTTQGSGSSNTKASQTMQNEPEVLIGHAAGQIDALLSFKMIGTVLPSDADYQKIISYLQA